ncbi:hypothetical protein [Rhizobium sp. S163]|jgi:hypothetical protein|uniref:hypothetical protein n=1 Tax=Rhizobium sp. S163 TaxID=3055039 RepID=UPI0025AA1073|nr:hypothetical protein [Rhizobium sp. S163]MDM9649279.1 hypothetical protein [Rhizobium sp. S163]
MGTEAPKDGASSKASSMFSSWRQTIWFLRILDSRSAARKILPQVGSADLDLFARILAAEFPGFD